MFFEISRFFSVEKTCSGGYWDQHHSKLTLGYRYFTSQSHVGFHLATNSKKTEEIDNCSSAHFFQNLLFFFVEKPIIQKPFWNY